MDMANDTPKRGRKRDPDRPVSALAGLRLTRGQTLRQVADGVGTVPSNVSKFEMKPEAMRWYWAKRFADYYGVDPTEVMFGGRVPMVPVVGYVGAGAAVELVDPYPKGGGLMEARCPRGLDPKRTVAVMVRGDSQAPTIPDGWIIFYSRDPEPDLSTVVNKLCVVKVVDGPVLLKQVKRGYMAGKFNLLSANAPMIEDVALEWAAPARGMVPGEQAQKTT